MKKVNIQKSILIFTALLSVSPLTAEPFTDNSDGTVTDSNTGLVWQKCSYGRSGSNCSTDDGDDTMNWVEALNYCKNLSLAGKTWRLPGLNELRSIIDRSRSIPAINPVAFPGTISYMYWSSSTVVNDTTDAWYVDFSYGMSYSFSKTDNENVRCVASGP